MGGKKIDDNFGFLIIEPRLIRKVVFETRDGPVEVEIWEPEGEWTWLARTLESLNERLTKLEKLNEN